MASGYEKADCGCTDGTWDGCPESPVADALVLAVAWVAFLLPKAALLWHLLP